MSESPLKQSRPKPVKTAVPVQPKEPTTPELDKVIPSPFPPADDHVEPAQPAVAYGPEEDPLPDIDAKVIEEVVKEKVGAIVEEIPKSPKKDKLKTLLQMHKPIENLPEKRAIKSVKPFEPDVVLRN